MATRTDDSYVSVYRNAVVVVVLLLVRVTTRLPLVTMPRELPVWVLPPPPVPEGDAKEPVYRQVTCLRRPTIPNRRLREHRGREVSQGEEEEAAEAVDLCLRLLPSHPQRPPALGAMPRHLTPPLT